MRTTGVALAFALGLNLAACSKEDSSTKAKAVPTKTTVPTKASPASAGDSAAVVAAVVAVMAPYEECRILLAGDRADGIDDCAKKMAAAATAAEAPAPAVARPQLSAIVSVAGQLGSTSTDLEAVRLTFGEVSKSVIALLTAVPTAAAKYRVFECPMAKGYQRWAQVDATASNPYMGTKMLECGTEVHDHHAGVKHAGHEMKHAGHEMKHD